MAAPTDAGGIQDAVTDGRGGAGRRRARSAVRRDRGTLCDRHLSRTERADLVRYVVADAP
jgi:hypothetical protein